MAEQDFMQDGVERINGAFRSIDDEFQRVQKQLKTRRRSIEKQINGQRKTVEKRTRKEIKRLRTELEKSPLFRRAESLRKDVTKQVEARIDDMLGAFQIASRSDVQKIDKKLNQIGRRLKEIEKSKGVTSSAA